MSEPETPRDVAAERGVRPCAWAELIDGGLITTDKVQCHDGLTPLYDQTALDAAVAAERERWRAAVLAGHLYEGDCPDEVNGLDSRDPACPLCALLGPNV